MNAKPKENHAEQNAQAWAESIKAMVAALECDYSRLEELREERADLTGTVKEAEDGQQEKDRHAAQVILNEWDSANGAELAELEAEATADGDKMENGEQASERIQESVLSVEVRSGWRAAGDDEGQAEEFCILLSTGGPALRIMGKLDEHCGPRRAWLEHQDWGTPWTEHYVEDFDSTLLTFCEQFYFGEG